MHWDGRNSATFHTQFWMQKLLFSGLLRSRAPEATPKLYPLHPKLFLPFWISPPDM